MLVTCFTSTFISIIIRLLFQRRLPSPDALNKLNYMGEKLILRAYQTEISDKAIKSNVIAVLDTGTTQIILVNPNDHTIRERQDLHRGNVDTMDHDASI